jgi:hypothetical protein
MGDAVDAADHEPAEPVEPDPMEVESARLLANEARPRLARQGLDDDIEELADEFIAGNQGGIEVFLAWLRDVKGIPVR